jgi:hypothetical protein
MTNLAIDAAEGVNPEDVFMPAIREIDAVPTKSELTSARRRRSVIVSMSELDARVRFAAHESRDDLAEAATARVTGVPASPVISRVVCIRPRIP